MPPNSNKLKIDELLMDTDIIFHGSNRKSMDHGQLNNFSLKIELFGEKTDSNDYLTSFLDNLIFSISGDFRFPSKILCWIFSK